MLYPERAYTCKWRRNSFSGDCEFCRARAYSCNLRWSTAQGGWRTKGWRLRPCRQHARCLHDKTAITRCLHLTSYNIYDMINACCPWKKIKKIHVKTEGFPEHNLPLVFSLPPGVPFHNSHDVLLHSNVLIVENQEGYTRVYYAGLCEENDIDYIFRKTLKLKKFQLTVTESSVWIILRMFLF